MGSILKLMAYLLVLIPIDIDDETPWMEKNVNLVFSKVILNS